MNHVEHIRWSLGFLILLGSCLMLTSCAWVVGEKMDHTALSRVAAEQAYAEMLTVPVKADRGQVLEAFTLKQCREMALANNLSLHIARLEQINRTHLSWAEWSKMLPHVILAAKFDQGDNILYGDLLGDSYWSEFYARSSWHLFLETRWSPTDVALAYYTARNAGNRLLQSFYDRVRLSQKIIETVEVSFFRLLTIQECLPLARDLVALRSDVTNRMERLLRERLAAPDDYEKALNDEMKAYHELAELKVQFERHANVLANHIGKARRSDDADPSTLVKGDLTSPRANEIPQEPEITALKNRPEIVALGLKQQEMHNELSKSIVKNFPRVSLFWRYLRDPYHHRRHHDGQQAGLLLYLDLVETLAQLKETQAAHNQRLRAELELKAITLAVASQAGVAAKKYQMAVEKAALVKKATAASERALKAAEQRALGRSLSDIGEKKARANLTAQRIELVKAIGEANVCLSELKCAVGTNY